MGALPGIIVTLVHGTWASNADYTSGPSPLRRGLRAEIPVEIGFVRFNWSGANTHAGRLQAGEELRRLLLRAATTYPNHAHFVIAHSHGGSVTMHALRDSAVRNMLDGVICFSTPFLVPTSDCAESYDEMWAVLPPALLIGGCALSGVFYLIYQGMDNLIALVAALILGALAGLACFFLSIRAFSRLFDRFQQYARDLAFPGEFRLPLLCIRLTADEPAFWLSALLKVVGFPVRVVQAITNSTAFEWALRAVIAAFSIFGVTRAVAWLYPPAGDVIATGWLMFLALLLGASALLVIPTLLMLLLAGISSHPLGVGADAWAFTVFGAMAVDRVPRYCPRAEEQVWTLREIASEMGWGPVLRLLRYGRHGLLVRSDVATKRVAKFITDILCAQGYDIGARSARP